MVGAAFFSSCQEQINTIAKTGIAIGPAFARIALNSKIANQNIIALNAKWKLFIMNLSS